VSHRGQRRSDGLLVVSSYATIAWQEGRNELSTLLSGNVYATDDPDMLTWLNAFAQPRLFADAIREFDPDGERGMASAVEMLLEVGALRDTSEDEVPAAEGWDTAALAFHQSSRRPGFRKSIGQGTPAMAPPRSTTRIALLAGDGGQTSGFVEVLESRQSRREWATSPISFEALSRFYWLSARNRALVGDGAGPETRVRCSRPYPSGGACYSLELYHAIVPGAVTNVPEGIYHYLPAEHALELLPGSAEEYQPFVDAAVQSVGAERVPTVIIVTSRYARQSQEYGRLAYSLVLKEIGCLMQTFYCVAECLGLAACALGAGSPESVLARLANSSPFAEPIVGEFVLGTRRG
jgi:SagB-type dehydrogenase family enzyme